MLREIALYQFQKLIKRKKVARSINDDEKSAITNRIWREEIKDYEGTKIDNKLFNNLRFNYLYDANYHLTIIFITDIIDEFSRVKKHLKEFHKEFIKVFKIDLDIGISCKDPDREGCIDLSPIYKIVNDTFKSLKPKVSIIGFSGVGKTTLMNLIADLKIPYEHIPTINGEQGTVKIGKLYFDFWDFAGQESFSYLWENFIEGSDGVLLITDSTEENCKESRRFIEIIKENAPLARYCAIGNKQDLPGALPVQEIEKILGMKTYSMVASDSEGRTPMINIIAELLEIDIEEIEILKILQNKEYYYKSAEAAINANDTPTAIYFLDNLVPVLIELGDDSFADEISARLDSLKNIQDKSESDAIQNIPEDNKIKDSIKNIKSSKNLLIKIEQRLSLLEIGLSKNPTINSNLINRILKISQLTKEIDEQFKEDMKLFN